MKKSFILIAAAAAMMASCADSNSFKEAADEQKVEQALSFSAFADKVTKAGNSNALNDFYTVFGVYGWKTVKINTGTEAQSVFANIPNEYFDDDKNGSVVYTSGKPSIEWVLPSNLGTGEGKRGYWYYENIRYWDKMATNYQFFAIAPYDASPIYTVAAGANNISIASADSKYDIQPEKNLALAGSPAVPQSALSYAGYDKDFMIADKISVEPTTPVTNADVQLVFHHILTKLNVKIKKDEDYKGKQELKVNKLKIANLAKEGYFVYKTAGMTTNGWTTSNKYDIDINTVYSLTADTNYDGYYWIENLIFPQTATKKAAGAQPTADDLSDIYLYIQYQIGNEVYNAYYDFADIWNSALGIDGEFEFKQGSEYDLTLTIGPKPIHFDAQVYKWATETAGAVTID